MELIGIQNYQKAIIALILFKRNCVYNKGQHQFNKKNPLLYKLTSKQTQQLIKYLRYNCTQEELNNALGYISRCPYCNSQDFYKTHTQSNLYKFKCEYCKKHFNILSKSSLSYLLLDEVIKRDKRFTYRNNLENIEVWLYFDVEYDRQYNSLPRKNNISSFFRLRHNLLQIPKDLKNDHLVNIQERDEESFNRLIHNKSYKSIKKKKNQKKSIILTFQENKFTSKKSISEFGNNFNILKNSTLQSYMNEDKKKKAQQEYENLKNILIEAYSKDCEILYMPNRDDDIYKNIENPYKYSYSLAYEMAIRNEDVKKILYAISYLKDIKSNLSLINSQDLKNKHSSTPILNQTTCLYDVAIEEYKQSLLSKYTNYLDQKLHNKYLLGGLYNLTSMIDDFEQELRQTYLIIPKDKKIVTPESNRILYQRIIHNSIDPKKYKWHPNYQQKNKYKYEEKDYVDYTISRGVLKGEEEFDVNVIRPTVNLHIIDKNTSLVPINFTLPTEEITAFIEKIKEDLKKDSEIIKTPMELLGEELEKIDEAKSSTKLPELFNHRLIAMANALYAYDVDEYLKYQEKKDKSSLEDEKNTKIKEIQKSKKFHREIQKEKVADIRRIYTYKKNAISKSAADRRKIIYKNIEAINNTTINDETVKNYLTFIREYIKELKYIKLFVKNQ